MTDQPRIALVTGAASGIGKAIAERLAQDGHHVIALDRSDTVMQVAQAIRDTGKLADGMIADLAHESQILKLMQDVSDRYGRLDILVNNAGVAPKRDGDRVPTAEIPTDQWNMALAINLTAPFMLCRSAIPMMTNQGWGRIINISSRAGRTYLRTAGAHYAATKAALIGMSRVLAGELGKSGITVNCVAPGRIVTPLSEQGSPELLASLKAEIPIGRAGETREIAAAVSFLASDDAAFITGSVMDVNGGALMA